MIKWLVCFVFVEFLIPNISAQLDKNLQVIERTIELNVDKPAEFPGGEVAMMDFLKKQLVYPARAKEEEISGKCYMQFVVTKEGLIVNVKVMRGVPGCPECDQECIRVIKSMPNWIPAQKDGKPVNSYYTIPFTFKTN
jgi:protein TonB